MTADIRSRIGNAEILPLDDLISSEEHPELQDTTLKYILVDANSFETAARKADPIKSMLAYALLSRDAEKQMIVFNIGKVTDRNLRLSRGYEALERLHAGHTSEKLEATLYQYCHD